MKKKVCPKCKQPHGINNFAIRNKLTNLRQSWCRFCQSDYRKQYYRNNRNIYIANAHARREKTRLENSQSVFEYLKKHPCVDCGETDPIVLQFDHVRAKKWKNVSVMVSMGFSWRTIVEEINKCDVRCANCHLRKTANERGWYRHIQSMGR
jgi:hypothetical protein